MRQVTVRRMGKWLKLIGGAVVVVIGVTAHADPPVASDPAAVCASSFPARLSDAREAIRAEQRDPSVSVAERQRFAVENLACASFDRTERLSLVPPDDAGWRSVFVGEVMCFENDSPTCDRMRAVIAEQRALLIARDRRRAAR